MKTIIFGSTGPLGLELVKQALKRGWIVGSFARSPHPMKDAENLHHIRRDIMDCGAVNEFVRDFGANSVVCALGVK